MHPRIAELVDVLSRERAALLGAVASVPPELLDRRPAPDRWSVGEILDHLRAVESGSARLLASRLERARAAGLPEETENSSVLDSLRYEPDPAAPREAPEIVRPRADARALDALDGLRASREALLQVLHDGDGLALGQVRATHGALGEIDLYQWALFIARHEEWHARQVSAAAAALGGTDASR